MTHEVRVWQQVQYEHTLGDPESSPWRITSRTRLEQRFRPQLDGNTGVRLRQQVRLAAPLYPGATRWLAVGWNEIFFNLSAVDWETGVQALGFDQNRIFGGLSWVAIPRFLSIEGGFFHQFLRRTTHVHGDLHTYALMTNVLLKW